MNIPVRYRGGPKDGQRQTLHVFGPTPTGKLNQLRFYIRAMRGAEDGRGQPTWQYVEADGSCYAVRWGRFRPYLEYIGVL